MTVLGSTAFAVLIWGAILAVVFAYELYALADEFGLVARAPTVVDGVGQRGATDASRDGEA